MYLRKCKLFNALEPTGYFMYHQVYRSHILLSVHTAYLCVLYRSQIIFLHNINCLDSVTETVCVYCEVRIE